jgi:release factor glutamine methyltransferase
MESIILSEIQKEFRSGLAGYYPDEEIRQLFVLVSEQVLSYSKIDTFLKAGDPISTEAAEKFRSILERMRKWEPVQYILGSASFYGLTFSVDRRVLIPRQETEELVQWIINTEGGRTSFLDIATGSGCIAVSVAANLKDAFVSACDVSGDALNIARQNALLNKTNVEFFVLDLLDDCAVLPAKYQVIVSNPPYVRISEKQLMLRNVLDYEPSLSLFVPDGDPLLFYKRIALCARKYLVDGGSLYLEINEHFPDEVMKLLQSTGFYGIELKKDLFGKYRMVKAIK